MAGNLLDGAPEPLPGDYEMRQIARAALLLLVLSLPGCLVVSCGG
ncbi:hypothetical protein [Longimicrobium sp.]|jgi:hypothetical protein